MASLDIGLAVAQALRALLGLALVLLLPGLAFTLAILPGARLRRGVRLLLALGLSLCLVILTGLALNYTPWGLRTTSWLLALAIITLIPCGLLVLRSRRSGRWPNISRAALLPALSLRGKALLIVAAATAAGALGMSAMSARSQQRAESNFTQLWTLPASAAGGGGVMQVGVRNDEQSAATYRLQLTQAGKLVYEWPSIQLNPGQTWQGRVSLSKASVQAPVQAELYRASDDGGKPYRQTVVWFGQA